MQTSKSDLWFAQILSHQEEFEIITPDNGLHELLRWSVRNMPETKQDTFSVSPQFANTLYPETLSGYSNGSIPQKNYYTKDKSIYGENTDKALDTISNILTATSLVPGIDTFADAAAIPVDLLRGDYISAGLDTFGVIPVVGEIADTAKLARAGINIAEAAQGANKLNITHRIVTTGTAGGCHLRKPRDCSKIHFAAISVGL